MELFLKIVIALNYFYFISATFTFFVYGDPPNFNMNSIESANDKQGGKGMLAPPSLDAFFRRADRMRSRKTASDYLVDSRFKVLKALPVTRPYSKPTTALPIVVAREKDPRDEKYQRSQEAPQQQQPPPPPPPPHATTGNKNAMAPYMQYASNANAAVLRYSVNGRQVNQNDYNFIMHRVAPDQHFFDGQNSVSFPKYVARQIESIDKDVKKLPGIFPLSRDKFSQRLPLMMNNKVIHFAHDYATGQGSRMRRYRRNLPADTESTNKITHIGRMNKKLKRNVVASDARRLYLGGEWLLKPFQGVNLQKQKAYEDIVPIVTRNNSCFFVNMNSDSQANRENYIGGMDAVRGLEPKGQGHPAKRPGTHIVMNIHNDDVIRTKQISAAARNPIVSYSNYRRM